MRSTFGTRRFGTFGQAKIPLWIPSVPVNYGTSQWVLSTLVVPYGVEGYTSDSLDVTWEVFNGVTSELVVAWENGTIVADVVSTLTVSWDYESPDSCKYANYVNVTCEASSIIKI